jgi:hypothetical protein
MTLATVGYVVLGALTAQFIVVPVCKYAAHFVGLEPAPYEK